MSPPARDRAPARWFAVPEAYRAKSRKYRVGKGPYRQMRGARRRPPRLSTEHCGLSAAAVLQAGA